MWNANHMVSLKFCVVLMARKRPTEYCIKIVLKNCFKSYLSNMSINNDFFGFLLACSHKPERAGKKTDIEFVDRVIISVWALNALRFQNLNPLGWLASDFSLQKNPETNIEVKGIKEIIANSRMSLLLDKLSMQDCRKWIKNITASLHINVRS